jgi:hypothetical protein
VGLASHEGARNPRRSGAAGARRRGGRDLPDPARSINPNVTSAEGLGETHSGAPNGKRTERVRTSSLPSGVGVPPAPELPARFRPMRSDRRPIFRALACVGMILAVSFGAVCRAAAQQAPPLVPPPVATGAPPTSPSSPGSGLQVIVTPFLPLTGINSAIGTPLARAPTVNSSVGAFQVLGHLDAVPFTGQIEISDGPFSL